jgi:hypothetical protein
LLSSDLSAAQRDLAQKIEAAAQRAEAVLSREH